MNGEQLYRLLSTIILRDLGKQPEDLIADSRDSCSTNGVAERLLGTLCPAMAKNKCISHVLVGTGQHIKMPTLSLFMVYLIQLLTHSHAFKLAFKEVMGESMPNYSKIRWWSRWDLMEVLARCFSSIDKLISTLEERGIGESSTVNLRDIFDSNWRELRRELAMVMDLKCFYIATYRLEGDGLEGLRLVDIIEEIRLKGRTLKELPSNMPNLAAVLRHEIVIDVGTKVYEYFGAPYSTWFSGKVTKVTAGSPKLYSIKYSDGTTMDSEEHEVRRWLHIHDSAEWLKYCDYASGGFTYLENRVTDNCPAAFYYKECYCMWSLARMFNPSYAAAHLSPDKVDALNDIVSLRYHNLIDGMKTEVHAYLTACAGVVVDMSSMHAFTDSVLLFWRCNKLKFPTWAKAAQIMFAMTPNSAGAERVFSLLKMMFPDERTLSLADLVEGSLMLKYNKAKRKAEKEVLKQHIRA